MNVQHSEDGKNGTFFIKDDGRNIAEMTYSRAGTDRIIIDHTEVSKEHRGEGIGEQLVEAAVAFARKEKIKIVSSCPFAKHVMESNEAMQDVL